jgi:hypothetical protein
MLDLHKRAGWVANDPNVAWHHFLRSRFTGRPPGRDRTASVTVLIHTIAQQSESDAGLRGLIEYTWDASVPVVFEFTGSLLPDTRELSIEELHPGQPGRIYSGQLSENGRVMTLREQLPGGGTSKAFHLIDEGTLALLAAD